LASGFLFSGKIDAYDDQTTHPDLTREIISFYELSTGKKLSDEQKQWVIQGSIDEDFAPRWLNHFYDPILDRGLDTSVLFVNGYSSKNWGLYSKYQLAKLGQTGTMGVIIAGKSDPSSMPFVFSYEAGIERYAKNREKDAYLTLGHILHLIEDLTVPEHTRNDPHPGLNDPSFYENWTANNSSGLTENLGKNLFNQGKRPIIYGDLGAYFDNLATYTNNHFFSPDTINLPIYQKPKIAFEDGTFAYGYDENGELFDLATVISDKSNKSYWLKDPQILQEYWARLSRQAVMNGAGVISLFLDDAEVAKKVELAKQKANENSLTDQNQTFFGFLASLFTASDSGGAQQPAMTITSGEAPTAPSQLIQIAEVAPSAPPPSAPAPAPNSANVSANVSANEEKAGSSSAISAPTGQGSTPSNVGTGTPTSPTYTYTGGGGGGSSNSVAVQQNQSQNNGTTATSTDSGAGIVAGDLIINEIMYDFEGSDTLNGKDREWVELYNKSAKSIDLTDWKLNDGDNATNHGLNVPPKNNSQGSMIMPAGGYIVLTGDAWTFVNGSYAGYNGAVIDTVMSLKNSSSTVKIIAPDGLVVDEVAYSSSWGANGDGKTLERKTAGGGSNDSANWAPSSANGGTPGAVNNYEMAGEGGPVATSTEDNLGAGTATSTPETATSTIQITGTGSGTDIAATTTISQNTTWTLSGSPYRLFFYQFERPTVASGATLTIEPGVKIIPQYSSYTALEVQGTLNAVGTAAAPIIFTSVKDADGLASTTPQQGDWHNVVFSAGSQINLDYAEFHYGGVGIMRPVKEMVKIVGAKVNINHSVFDNAQGIALRLIDADAIVENSVFSNNSCGISVDSLVRPDLGTDGGCYGDHSQYSTAAAKTTPQIRNNQFLRNRTIGVEIRNGSTPIIDGNTFTDNYLPARVESSYPTMMNSILSNSSTSPNFIGAISLSGYTQWTENFTLRKDLPYLLQSNGPAWSPHLNAGATMTVERGVIFKTDHNGSAMFIDGNLIVSGAVEDPVIFTSFKDDSVGGDSNGDGAASTPRDRDWNTVKIASTGSGTFTNANFTYGKQDYTTEGPEVQETLNDFTKQSLVTNTMGASSKHWQAQKNGNFVRVVFHDFATVNPQNFPYLAGIKRVSDNSFAASTTITNLQNIATKELEVAMSGSFAKDESYYAILQVVPPTGSTADIKDVFQIGVDDSQMVAVSFHEFGPKKIFHSAISVDTGGTVVVQ